MGLNMFRAKLLERTLSLSLLLVVMRVKKCVYFVVGVWRIWSGLECGVTSKGFSELVGLVGVWKGDWSVYFPQDLFVGENIRFLF